MNLKAIAFAVAGFSTSIFAAFVVADFSVTQIENSALRTTRTALVASGQSWAEVKPDGALIVFSGTAPDEQKRIQALDVLSAVVSSARIVDETDVEETAPVIAPSFSLEILRSGSDISLIGITPSDAENDTVHSAIRKISEASLIDMNEATDWKAPAGWQAALEYGADIMIRLGRVKISIQPGIVSVTAVVKSPEDKARLEEELRSDLPENVELVLAITAPRPMITTYRLNFVMSQETTTLKCDALTPESAEQIIEAARLGGLQEDVSCNIGLGAPSGRWASSAIAGIEMVISMGGGELKMLDKDIILIAPDGFNPDKFGEITAEYKDRLSEKFELHAILPFDPNADDTELRAHFEATLASEGEVVLSGVVIDPVAKLSLETYATAKFGFDTVTDQTRIAEYAPHGWTTRILAAIDALAMLNEGEVQLGEDNLTLVGKGEIVNLEDALKDYLEGELGTTARFSIDVEVTAPVVQEVVLADTKECEDEISAILAENQILFAPSSAIIEEESEATLDDIAIVLNRCRHASFQIGGHTDSQGSEELNKGLSQNRADAVLDALLAQELLLGDLTALGYGESQPIADNETEEGRQENRRIAFKLLE